jgi:hypothetical protein
VQVIDDEAAFAEASAMAPVLVQGEARLALKVEIDVAPNANACPRKSSAWRARSPRPRASWATRASSPAPGPWWQERSVWPTSAARWRDARPTGQASHRLRKQLSAAGQPVADNLASYG